MASITAIELGADTCALARTSVRRGVVRVLAVEALDPAAFPGGESFSVALRQARRTLKLPRRARVVIWGLPEGANRNDAAVKPLLAPLTAAGFRVERVVSPCNALAALARVRVPRSRENATCWVAINRGGVAIVVVRPGKQIYAHSFVWDSTVGASGSQARLLQRYSLVSFLSPEVERAMAEARKHGTPVDAVVTCGNLPDLRSLTMPLIEELDVEVETLDSLDGLVVKPPVAERIGEAASAIRLVCAGVLARGTRPWDESKRRAAQRAGTLFRAAAVMAGLAVIGFAWYEYRVRKPLPPQVARSEVRQTLPQPPKETTTVLPTPAAPRSSTPEPRPSPLGPRPSTLAPRPSPAGVIPATPAADKSQASTAAPRVAPRAGPAPMPPLLKEPMPRVTAILVANDRRFATVNDGQIIGVGDVLGGRIVIAIDDKAVVLREPSGVQIRVGLGGRVLAIERGRN